MASYLDGATIVAASIAFVMYTQAGFPIGPGEMGLLSGLLTFGLAIGAAVGGRLGDVLGRRRVLYVDLVVLSAGLACLTFAPDVSWLLVGAGITGFAMGVDLPVSISLAAEQGRVGQRGRLVGITNLLWLGGIGGVILVANLVTWLALPPLPAARVMFGHVLVVAVVVWGLRLRVGESQLWHAARERARAAPQQRPGVLRPTALRGLWTWRSALFATGLYYLLWNLQANTSGQFNAYLFTEVAGGSLATFNLIGLLTLPLGIVAGLLSLRVLDTRHRLRAYLAAGSLGALVLLVPAVWGVSVATMLPLLVMPGLLAPFAAESLYKIWTQEVFPTLVRSTAQGITIFACRLGTGLFALVTPKLATTHPTALFWLLFGTTTTSFLIGWLWVARLPPASDD
jgi:inositol transporter-like SP family MFS transporter